MKLKLIPFLLFLIFSGKAIAAEDSGFKFSDSQAMVQSGHDFYRSLECADGSSPYFKSVANRFWSVDVYTIECKDGTRGIYEWTYNQKKLPDPPKGFYFKKTKGTVKKQKAKLQDVPKEVIKPCLDKSGKIADIEQDWQFSDSPMTGGSKPRSHLMEACKLSDTKWQLVCQTGGYSINDHRYDFELKDGKWVEVSRKTGKVLRTECGS